MPVEDTSYITRMMLCIGISWGWRLSEISMWIQVRGIKRVAFTGMVSYFHTTNAILPQAHVEYTCYIHNPIFHWKCIICGIAMPGRSCFEAYIPTTASHSWSRNLKWSEYLKRANAYPGIQAHPRTSAYLEISRLISVSYDAPDHYTVMTN